MYKFWAKFFCAVVVICAVFSLFAFPSSAADDGWTYGTSLPSTVTSANYTIQYNNVYKTTASSSPGSGWTNKGLAYSRYENYGSPYYSNIELATSETRVLLSYGYYHYCSRSMGTRVNFTLSDPYNHYDSLTPGNFYEYAVYIDDDDARYKAYRLKYYDGSDVYCSSGYSCDGSFGSHGNRSYIWYKTSRYQDRVLVNYYNYEKQSGWTSSKDPSASSCTVRYKLNHAHSLSDWTVTKKASFTADGSKYRTCKGCGQKVTGIIPKVSSAKLSTSAYTYNGKTKTPKVTLKDSSGNTISSSKYTVSYQSGRKNIGAYKVTVKLKSKYYSGTKILKFKIVPAQVKNLKATAGKNSVTLRWDKGSGGLKYRIYSYNKSTGKLTHITDTSNTYYTAKSLKSSKKYYYVVKAFKAVDGTNYYSKASSAVGAHPYGAPSQVKNLKASSKTSTSVTLKWDKASGNKVQYYIYSYNPSTGKYTQLGKTKSTSYTVKKLKAKTKYRYAVRAYSAAGGGYNGKLSSVYTVTTYKTLTSPSVGTVSLSTEGKLNNVLVKWTANSKATGYKVYRSTTGKSGSFTCVAKIKDSAAYYYRDTSVSAAATYYYKVQSYTVRGKETAKSSCSSVKKITTYAAWYQAPQVGHYAFSFINSRSDFGYQAGYIIPISSYQIIYGNTALATQMYNKQAKAWYGSCYGMCVSSSLFNVRSSGVTLSKFSPSAAYINQLKVTDTGALGISVKQLIEAMQISYPSSYLAKKRTWGDLNATISAVNQVQSTGKPVIISVYGMDNGKEAGHSLLAFKAEKVSSTQTNIYVYDCNYSNQVRTLVITTDTSGKAIAWRYQIRDNVVWGTEYEYEYISCEKYDDYSAAWTNKSALIKAAQQSNALYTNSSAFSIYDESNNLVAAVSDGEITSSNGDVYLAQPCTEETESLLLYVPADETYTVVNNDSGEKVFEATMVNVDRLAEVSTQSDSITFTVSDKEEINSVSVCAEENEQFNIVLDSSEDNADEKVEVSGKGNGEVISVAVESGEIYLNNCDGADIFVDSEQ